MADKLDDALADAVNKAVEGAEQLTAALTQLASKHGDHAVDLMLTTAKMDALAAIIPNIVALLICGAVILAGYIFIKTVIKKDWHDGGSCAEIFAPPAVAIIVATIVALINLGDVVDIWAWAGIFYPELWIVHKFILK